MLKNKLMILSSIMCVEKKEKKEKKKDKRKLPKK